MSLEDDIAFFEQVPTLAVLGKNALRVLAIGAETRSLPSGAVLFYAGELADGGYVIQQGSILLEPGTPAEGEEITLGPGALIGELALLTDMVSPATAIAKEPTVLIRISRNLFKKMLEGYPASAKKLHDIMAGRLDDWTRELDSVKNSLEKGAISAHLHFNRRRHRHMVGGPRGAAIILGDRDGRHAVGERVRCPDVVEPAAAVGIAPVVHRPITPPRVELFRLRREHAHGVDPAAGIARGVELFAFDRRMRDHLQHLLVAPDVVLERRDVEVADQNRALRSFRPEALMAAHLVEK